MQLEQFKAFAAKLLPKAARDLSQCKTKDDACWWFKNLQRNIHERLLQEEEPQEEEMKTELEHALITKIRFFLE